MSQENAHTILSTEGSKPGGGGKKRGEKETQSSLIFLYWRGRTFQDRQAKKEHDEEGNRFEERAGKRHTETDIEISTVGKRSGREPKCRPK